MTGRPGLAYLNAAHFLDHFFLLIFPTAVIAIESDWGLGYGEALALGTPMYVAFALATLPAGWLGDHLSRHKLISGFFLGCGGASIVIGSAGGPVSLAAGLALLGIFAAIYHPVGLAMVTELAERRGRALAVNGVFGNMGLAGAALITGLLTEAFGWRSAFLVPGVVSIGIGVGYLWHGAHRRLITARVEPDRHRADVKDNRSRQIRVFVIILIAAFFGGAVFNAVTTTLPKLFDERLMYSGIDLAHIGGYVALVFSAAAFAQLPVGDLLDRFGARPVLIGVVVPQALGLVLISQLSGMAVVPVALFLVVFMFAEIPVTSWLVGHYIPTRWRSRAFSVEYILSLGMAATIVPLIAWGHRSGFGFDRQYVVLAGAAGLVIAAALFLPARKRNYGDSLPNTAELR